MPDAPITLTDANLDRVLNGEQPVLILFTNGEGLRSDFKVAFDKSAKEDTSGKIVYARVDPRQLPALAERFGVGDKPVLVAWYCGEEVARRQKPWGTDLPLAIEMLQKAVTDSGNILPEESVEEENPVSEPTVLN